jgi:hypothetical protein
MEYQEYDIVEKHLYFSKKLNNLNYKGRRLMYELEVKKRLTNSKNKFIPLVKETFGILTTITKPKSLCNNIYSSLLHFLDELLFMQVKTTDIFIIGDDEYPLSYIYFNHSEWIDDENQDFMLDDDPNINDLEALLINCYIDEYELVSLEIETFLVDIMKEYWYVDRKMFKKMLRLLSKLKKRLLILKSKVLVIIYKTLDQY